MKTIIAGTRTIEDYDTVKKAIIDSGFNITMVVSGVCRGVDKLGQRWAKENNIPIKKFPADWKQYSKRAGPIRNKAMAEYADALIVIWDGFSRGTNNMINNAKKNNLPIHEVNINGTLV